METATLEVALSLLKTDGQYLAAIALASAVFGIGTMQFVVRPFWPKPENVDIPSRWWSTMPAVARLTGMAWCLIASCLYFHYMTPMRGLYLVQIVAALPLSMFSGFLTPYVYDKLKRKKPSPDDDDGDDTTRFNW